MAGKSPLTASTEQMQGLEALAASRDRGEADPARAVLLTLRGWSSRRIAEAFAVREDTVRLWRSDFMHGGFEALKASIAGGPVPVKTEADSESSHSNPLSLTDPTGRSHVSATGADRRRPRVLAGQA
jgi:Helix-turn-helix domain